MAGNSVDEAIDSYAQPIQAALSCITPAKLATKNEVLTFQHGEPVRLNREHRNEDGSVTRLKPLYLELTQHYRVEHVPDDLERGPYRVSIVGWDYVIQTRTYQELLVFHWHPNQRSSMDLPHLHIGSALIQALKIGDGHDAQGTDEQFQKVEERIQEIGFLKGFSNYHIPTGRVSVEQLVRMCITEFDVIPMQSNWSQKLDETEDRFERFRSWSGRSSTF